MGFANASYLRKRPVCFVSPAPSLTAMTPDWLDVHTSVPSDPSMG